MTLLIFVVSLLGGVLFWNVIAGRFEGDRLERSLRIPLGCYYLHVHHWLYCLCAMGGLCLLGIHHPWTYGLLCGSVMQGFTYRDWYLLLYRKCDAEVIYARWNGLGAPEPKCEN
jgi:hypothetical protein